MADVPAWVAVSTTALSAAGGILAAQTTARAHERELRQERLLHGASSRLHALEQAVALGSDCRQRVAEALHRVAGTESSRVGVEPMWTWDPAAERACKEHEAALIFRFGQEHPATEAWRYFEWALAKAAYHASNYKKLQEEPLLPVPPDAKLKAEQLRIETRQQREVFIREAAKAVEDTRPPQASARPIARVRAGLRLSRLPR
jgi:hypothetical protein